MNSTTSFTSFRTTLYKCLTKAQLTSGLHNFFAINSVLQDGDYERVEAFLPNSCALNIITGDGYLYQTKRRHCLKQIYLLLSGGTFSTYCMGVAESVNVDSTKKRTLLIYNNKNECYAYGKPYNLTTRKLKDAIACKSDTFSAFNNTSNMTNEEYYKYVKTHISQVNKHLFINVYSFGNIKNTALALFYQLNQFYRPDPISYDEYEYIDSASTGSLMFCEKGYSGTGYKSDFVSYYPAILSEVVRSNNTASHNEKIEKKKEKAPCIKFEIPIKKGAFKLITQQEFDLLKFVPFGIIKCIVHPSGDPEIDKLFRFNHRNSYTHTDLNAAIKYKLKVEIIYHNRPHNMLFYNGNELDNTRVNSGLLFGDYNRNSFPLKEDGNPFGKQLLNLPWGALCEENYKKSRFDKPFDNHAYTLVNSFFENYYTDDGFPVIKFVFHNTHKPYKTNYARLKPFLLAKGRDIMANTLRQVTGNNIADVVYCHTDGFITKTKPDVHYGTTLGAIRNEGFSDQCSIINLSTKVQGF